MLPVPVRAALTTAVRVELLSPTATNDPTQAAARRLRPVPTVKPDCGPRRPPPQPHEDPRQDVAVGAKKSHLGGLLLDVAGEKRARIVATVVIRGRAIVPRFHSELSKAVGREVIVEKLDGKLAQIALRPLTPTFWRVCIERTGPEILGIPKSTVVVIPLDRHERRIDVWSTSQNSSWATPPIWGVGGPWRQRERGAGRRPATGRGHGARGRRAEGGQGASKRATPVPGVAARVRGPARDDDSNGNE